LNDGNLYVKLFTDTVIVKCCLFAAILLYQAGGLGITAGAHRLWAHRAYKAKWPLKLILVIFNTLAFQVRNKNCEHFVMKNFTTSTSDI